MPTTERSYTASRFALMLDGVQTGFVKSVEGGGVKAEVIHEASDSSYFVKKHIGPPMYEPFTVEIDLSMAASVYEWIAATWTGKIFRTDGAITTVDTQFKAVSEQQFTDALLTAVTTPTLDGTAKKEVFFALTFAPEHSVFAKAGGKVAPAPDKKAQKKWLPSNFRLTIDGLDCTRVMKIDSFTVKYTPAADTIGDARDYLKEPGKLEFPNLKIKFSASSAQTWRDWFESFVVKGNNDESHEKHGEIVLLAPDMKPAATIRLFNLGIFKLADDTSDASAAAVKRLTADLYCERMEFQHEGKFA